MVINLKNRKVVKIEGKDKYSFLQGLITNDINKVENGPIYTALLSAQGKFLFDFFICKRGGIFFLTPEKDRFDDFIKKLRIYKLRSDISIEPLEGWSVYADLSMKPPLSKQQENYLSFLDPRDERMGNIILTAESLEPAGTMADYDTKRIDLCIPDGSQDMPIDKAIILENRLDELKAIDWDKGCYLGQELMARTKHRGLVRKTLMKVIFEGSPPENNETLFFEGAKAGSMRTSCKGKGLALLRIEIAKKSRDEDKPLTSESGKKVFITS